MKAAYLLLKLVTLRIDTHVVGERLLLRGNTRALPPGLMEQLREEKPRMLRLLQEPEGFCWRVLALSAAYHEGRLPDSPVCCETSEGERLEADSLHRLVGGLLGTYEAAPDEPETRRAIVMWTQNYDPPQDAAQKMPDEPGHVQPTPICVRCRQRPALGTDESPLWCGVCVEADRRILRSEGLLRDGVCIVCHSQPARHPHLSEATSERLRKQYPPLYCSACWNSDRWKEGLPVLDEKTSELIATITRQGNTANALAFDWSEANEETP